MEKIKFMNEGFANQSGNNWSIVGKTGFFTYPTKKELVEKYNILNISVEKTDISGKKIYIGYINETM